MSITRRNFTIGTAAVGASALGIARPAIAQVEPIRIGWLAALTGASSAPAIGFNRGVMFAAAEINAAGGVKGRKIELTTRDTQGDPAKAVNATQEMISQVKVHAIWGPTNSGESLAVTPIMARSKTPNVHPCVVESLIDTTKFPNAFRMAPSNTQWDDAVRFYAIKVLKAKRMFSGHKIVRRVALAALMVAATQCSWAQEAKTNLFKVVTVKDEIVIGR